MSIKQKNSKIFVRNVTVLDCGVWDKTRGPVGRSWNVDVEWHGTTDEEGVVVDFSAAKKIAKNIIDEQFDHRLLISEHNVLESQNGRKICVPYSSTLPENRFLLETYPQSLAIVSDDVFDEIALDTCSKLERILAMAIHEGSPSNISRVTVKLNWHNQHKEAHFFNYLHSLRMHAGNCQRFHGHSNIVEIFSGGRLDEAASERVARFLDGKYLITPEYLCAATPLNLQHNSDILTGFELDTAEHMWLKYSGTQGEVVVCAPRERVILMPDESTIEHISAWIHESFFADRSEVEVRGYEGLNKGALFP
jgi:6-pyruvoyl-tetrahydropterin synthase